MGKQFFTCFQIDFYSLLQTFRFNIVAYKLDYFVCEYGTLGESVMFFLFYSVF